MRCAASCDAVRTPKELLDEALEQLAAALTFQEDTSPASHTLILISGLEAPECPTALARYAVGVLAGWVQHDATIAERFVLQGVDGREELRRLVARIADPGERGGDQLKRWRETWRDPWIAEVLVHALLVITRTHATRIVTGPVHAILAPHPVPKRHGLDALAIYAEPAAAGPVPVMAVGETKASEEDGTGQLTIACDSFDDVEKGLSGPDLRDALKVLAPVLPVELAAGMPEELWKEHRCYLAAIVHEVAFDGTNTRPRLDQLTPVVARKRLASIRTATFQGFFEQVAAAMPAAIDEVVV
jgi:hypothetical protein